MWLGLSSSLVLAGISPFKLEHTICSKQRPPFVPASLCNSQPGLVKKKIQQLLLRFYGGGCRGRFQVQSVCNSSGCAQSQRGRLYLSMPDRIQFSITEVFYLFVFFMYMWEINFNMIKSIDILWSKTAVLNTLWCSFTEWVVFFMASEWPLYEMLNL